MNPRDFVIRVRYGGLGDHLFWSHLPRIAKMTGRYNRVYISSFSNFGNNGYRKLIWDLNPYVDGYVDEDAPAPAFSRLQPGTNILDMLMLDRGLDDGVRFHEPEIFYRPKFIPEVSESKVFDPNYVSNVGALSASKLLSFLRQSGGVDYQMAIRDLSSGSQLGIPILKTADVFEYCDIIASCREFFCLTSGGATLAPALGKAATVFYGYGQNSAHRHSKLNTYVDLSEPLSQVTWPISQLVKRVSYGISNRLCRLHVGRN